MMPPTGALDALKCRRPEWSPWIAVVEEVLRESASGRWQMAVPDLPAAGDPSAPLLSAATIVVDGAAVRRLLDRLVVLASGAGTPKMATLGPAMNESADVAALFGASICQDAERVARIAASCGADAEALQAVVALVSIPFLQACNRRWGSSTPKNWIEGHCSVCGSWPAFAEIRGIERSRYLRCGRCGGEWHAHILQCAYCATRNHDELVTLVPEKAGSRGAIEACSRCDGYLKAFTKLQGCPPATVMLEDLGSVDLDVAALEQGYRRPPGPGRTLEVVVNTTAGAPRFFTWNA